MASATPNARPRLPLRSTALFALGLGAWIGGPPAALATDPVPDPVLGINQLLAQAMPDECFDGVGVDYLGSTFGTAFVHRRIGTAHSMASATFFAAAVVGRGPR